MYVCICNAVTETQILEAAQAGAQDLWDLQRQLGVASGCGSCKAMASNLLREARNPSSDDAKFAQPVRYNPAIA